MAGVTSTPAALVLLVEDDLRLASLTREYLEGHGLAVFHVADGRRGLEEALSGRYDAVLLDLMLPGKDGLEVCRELRGRSDVPVIVLTARGEEPDRVLGLELGADDYLAKPFSPRELLARIRAVTRRARGRTGPERGALRVGRLHLDPGTRSVTVDGREVALTGHEFSLLEALARRAGRILSREQLIELAGGSPEDAFDRSVDVHVSRLRQKLGDDPKRPRLIKTVRGAGYLLAGEAAGLAKLGAAPWLMRSLLLIPLLQIVGVAATLRRLRSWQVDPSRRPSRGRLWRLHILLPLVPYRLTSFVADNMSRISTGNHDERNRRWDYETILRNFAAGRFESGCDAVISAHFHTPNLNRFETAKGEKFLLSLGDWKTQFSYGEWTGDSLTLEQFTP